MSLLLRAHAGATLMMMEIIWFARIVHYPLFVLVGSEGFTNYHRRNVRRTAALVVPLIFVEGISGVLVLGIIDSVIRAHH